MPHEGLPFHDKLVGIPHTVEHLRPQVEEEHARRSEISNNEERKNELEKTARDLELIDFTQRAVIKKLQAYGRRKNTELPLERIHLVPEHGTKEGSSVENEGGSSNPIYASIIVDRVQSDAKFSLVLFHELLHSLSYKVVQITNDPDPKKRDFVPYRNGITIVSRDGTRVYFGDLEEGIVSLLTHEFEKEDLKNDPSIKKELDALGGNAPDDFHSREKELNKLNKLVDDLWEKTKETHPNRRDILDLFIRAQVNGDLMPLARLVEQVYGSGSFRKLAEEDPREIP